MTEGAAEGPPSTYQALQKERRVRVLEAMSAAGVFPHEPLGFLLLTMVDDQVAQSAAIDSLLERTAANANRLEALLPEVRREADAEMRILREQTASARQLAATVKVQVEEYGRNQATVMTGAVVRETLESLREAVYAMWRQELPATVQDLLFEFRFRWIVIGLLVILAVMGIGAGITYEVMRYPERIGRYCLTRMIADTKDDALWCQLNWHDVRQGDRGKAGLSSNH
ncbi:hypothetical protein [Gluconacetobacter azotocaptans]|uniref:hypothetical protein n=1 Tax=Gluconacetobacter azotocaptans TaxID=142834 RepID=UPI001C817B16|nr:hypothetical protein [Gluconacetobacter azotocaptans]GBQ33779.1 hypothetical protein AA13594_2711 [Gluconacetobacter azotocaptans DSM 13594]